MIPPTPEKGEEKEEKGRGEGEEKGEEKDKKGRGKGEEKGGERRRKGKGNKRGGGVRGSAAVGAPVQCIL